jgi:tetratricopeptide (TPR) repeat protein
MTADGELSRAAEAQWAPLERHLQLVAGFWLGFLFAPSTVPVEVMRERTRRIVEGRGRTFVLLAPETPEDLRGVVARLVEPDAVAAACVWVEAIREDAPGVEDGPWALAWQWLLLRMNERRDLYRRRFAGGLMLAGPPPMKAWARVGAGDLWSVRIVVVDVPPEPRIEPFPLGTPAVRGPEEPSGIDVDLALAEAERRAGRGGGSAITEAAALVRAARGMIEQGRAEAAEKAAEKAAGLLEGTSGMERAEALATLAAAAWAVHRSTADAGVASDRGERAAQHVAEALRLAEGTDDPRLLAWYPLDVEIALGRRERARAREAAGKAVALARRIHGDVAGSLVRVGDLARAQGDLGAARTAYEEAVAEVRGELARSVGEDAVQAREVLSTLLIKVAEVLREQGDEAAARAAYDETLGYRTRTKNDAEKEQTMSLPPLTERMDRGAAGGNEFERLMHQLLLRYGDKERFSYEPVSSAGGDGGLDGLAPKGGVPGIDGPVAFQFKWLWGEIHKGSKAAQIKDSFKRAAADLTKRGVKHWVLVTPWDVSPAEKCWLDGLGTGTAIAIRTWGREKIESLLRLCPPLFARYYPHEAAHEALPPLAGYDGFDFREFAASYRDKISLAYERIRTIGLPPKILRERDARPEIRLRDIFVPLRFVAGKSEQAPVSLADALRDKSSAVVLGDPGAGKSTLLAFLALLFAGGATLEGYAPRDGVVPLLVSLRDFARVQQAKPDLSFVEYLEIRARSDHGLAHAHRAFFESALRMGEAFVLVDGLDEVGRESARHRIARALRAFRHEYPYCPFWVTSRIYGYTPDVRLPEPFAELRVGRLDDEQVDGFVGRWYAIQLPHNERERGELTESLRHAVHRTPSVRRLAGNPLLLTLMAFIHQGLRRLPTDRGELYDLCVDMLLRDWQDGRRGHKGAAEPHPFEKLGLHVQTQKDYLAHLALFMQERNEGAKGEDARGLVTRDDAIACLAKRHVEKQKRTRPGLDLPEAHEEMGWFLDYLCDETGLVVDRGGGQLAFIHLSFQEYLAAWVFMCRPIAVEEQIRFFSEHLGVQAWEEVLLLRFYVILRKDGGGGDDVFDTIVNALLSAAFKERQWLTLARAVRDNLDFSPQQRTAILEHALVFWEQAQDPGFDGNWFAVLDEIVLFADKACDPLKALLDASLAWAPPESTVRRLELRAKLFGFPPEAATRLRTRQDLAALLPDLVVLWREPGMADLVAERGTRTTFATAFDMLDGPELHRLSAGWASGAEPLPWRGPRATQALVGVVWRKAIEELRSRAQFALARKRSDAADLFQRPGRIAMSGPFWRLEAPLAGAVAPDVALWGGAPPVRMPFEAPRRSKLQASRLAASHNTVATFDAPLVRWAQGFVEATVAIPSHDIAVLFVRSFVRSSGRSFGRDFDRSFVRSFGRDFGRSFVRSFGRSFVRSFHSNFARDFGRSFGRSFGRDFVLDFGIDFVVDFGRSFGRSFGLDPDAPDWEAEWVRLLGQEENVVRLLGDEGFWDRLWIYSSQDPLELEPGPPMLRADLQNPLALPLLLTDVWNAASTNALLALWRAVAVAYPDCAAPDGALEAWLRRHPLDVYATAFAWEHHAAAFDANLGRLAGPHGALMLAHAAFAALMTGLSLDTPTWTKLLADRDAEDPCIAFGHALYELCSLHDREENARIVHRFLESPPDALRAVLDPTASE